MRRRTIGIVVVALMAGCMATPTFAYDHQIILSIPTTDDEQYDHRPIGAIEIKRPLVPSTRNFVSGIWIETKGSEIDKSRGIIVNNWGRSDAMYLQLDGQRGTGLAVLNNGELTTGIISENRHPSAVALVLQQGLGGGLSNLLSLWSEQPGEWAELGSIASSQPRKVGLAFRMAQPGSKAIAIKGVKEEDLFHIDADTGQLVMPPLRAASGAHYLCINDGGAVYSSPSPCN